MTVSETLRQASEALQQASAALAATAQAMEDAPGLEPAPEPAPGEWRNDRAPKECDTNDTLRVWVWQSGAPVLVSCDLVSFWYESCPARNYWALGHRPAPKSPPPDVVASQEVEPHPDASPEPGKSRTGGWIVDRLPMQADADRGGHVLVPSRNGSRGMSFVHFLSVFPGTPWAPVSAETDPWDPTCLDRNGWIRSRLPTVEDTGSAVGVLIPVGHGGTTSTIAYHLIVPGQPWAPWDSSPGVFSK